MAKTGRKQREEEEREEARIHARLNDWYRECGQRMRRRMIQLDINLELLSLLTGFDEDLLLRLEKGETIWTHTAGEAIAVALECSDDDLRPEPPPGYFD